MLNTMENNQNTTPALAPKKSIANKVVSHIKSLIIDDFDEAEKPVTAMYSEPISKIAPQREMLADYGFEQAGLANGNIENFVSHLELIKNGHFLDADHKNNKKRDEILALINQVEEQKTLANQHKIEITQLENAELSQAKNIKTRLEDDIASLKTDEAKEEEASEYSTFSVIQYLIFGFVFLVGGMLLYACMINLVFFNSINISTINAENIGNMMSLFARVNFSIPFNTTVSIIMAGVILFGASYLESKSKLWLIGILLFDFLLAYTIENQVADLKTAMGLEVKINDLILEGCAIAIFSFFGYFGFAQSIAKLKAEIDKKNPHKGIKIKIETLKNRITEAEKMIGIVENKRVTLI
ncbi:MAG: hypothetical protein RL308_2590 [Bacteroidota bacterium]|jgi:hypothetical protein